MIRRAESLPLSAHATHARRSESNATSTRLLVSFLALRFKGLYNWLATTHSLQCSSKSMTNLPSTNRGFLQYLCSLKSRLVPKSPNRDPRLAAIHHDFEECPFDIHGWDTPDKGRAQ